MPALLFRKHLKRQRWKRWDRVLDINVRGVFIATQAALKHMKSGGRIIMIGSSVGERVMVPGLVPYAATKGAVKILLRGSPENSGAGASQSITCSQVRSTRS